MVVGGWGRLGRAVAAALDATDDCSVVARAGREMNATEWAAVSADVVVDATTPGDGVEHARIALQAGRHALVLATDTALHDEYVALGELAAAAGLTCAVLPNLSLSMAVLESSIVRLSGRGGRLRIVDITGPGVPVPLQTTRFLARLAERHNLEPELAAGRDGSALSVIRLEWSRGDERLLIELRGLSEAVWGAGAVDVVRNVDQHRGLVLGMAEAVGPVADGTNGRSETSSDKEG